MVLAKVGSTTLTPADLVQEAEWRKANNQAVPAAEQLLKEMVDRLALVERAKQAGLDRETDTRRRMESLLIATLREKELDQQLAKIEVSEQDLAAAYEARQAEFTRKGTDRFAILFQAVQPNASETRRTEAKDRLKSALSLADANPASGGRGAAAGGFGAVAVDYSEDQITRYRGGDLGWIESDVTASRLPETVLAAGRALKSGARSEVLEARDGFYVIMKTDTRPGGVLPLADVSPRLRQTLLRELRRSCEERFMQEAVSLAKVEMNAAAAKDVSLPISHPPVPSQDVPPSFPGEEQPAAAAR